MPGLWLDRGELDKVIERSLQQPAYGTPPPVQDQPVQDRRDPRAGYAPDRRYQAYSAPSAPSPEDHGYGYGQRERRPQAPPGELAQRAVRPRRVGEPTM